MSDKWHGGKGSRYRKVDQKAYNDNWERVFGKKDMKFTTAEEYINSTSDYEDVLDGEEENTETKRETDT